jgi:3-dehydroquinate synthetase
MIEIITQFESKCIIDFIDIKSYNFPNNSVYIVDKNIFENNSLFENEKKLLIVESSEKIKSLKFLPKIYSFLYKNNVKKDGFINCIGGGTLCDLVGFASNSYLRGINLNLIPTTLLSMSDAAIGGKNAINYGKMKNTIGSFKLPNQVLIDISFLETLPNLYFLSGIAEIIKIAILKSNELFELIEENITPILNKDYIILNLILQKAIELKVNIINRDFIDNNERILLNFGHTIGHSIELIRNIPHGFAVAEGILYALEISGKLNYIQNTTKTRIINLLHSFNLLQYHTNQSPRLSVLFHDKKNLTDSVKMILLKDIEKPFIIKFKNDEFRKIIKNLFKY